MQGLEKTFYAKKAEIFKNEFAMFVLLDMTLEVPQGICDERSLI
jgi:hypothetical protein